MIGARRPAPSAPLGPAPRRTAAPVPRKDPRIAARRLATALVALVGLAVVVVVAVVVVGPVRVGTASMAPDLRAGDVVLVDRLHVDVADLRHGDLVTLRYPGTGTRGLDRVVAVGTGPVPGDERVASVTLRDHGPVAQADLEGRVLGRIWPPRGTRASDPPPLTE